MARQKANRDKGLSKKAHKTEPVRVASDTYPIQQNVFQAETKPDIKPQKQAVLETEPGRNDTLCYHEPHHVETPRHTVHYEHKQERRQFVENYELPRTYDNTGVTLIARDPNFVHAYWDIASKSMEEMRKRLGGEFERSVVTLRMYDVTSINFNGNNANKWFDIDIGHDPGNWYVNMWCDNVAYCADLGMRTPGHEFISMARSNYIATPSASQSHRGDLIWMDIKDNLTKIPFILVDKRTGRSRAFKRNDDGTIEEVITPRKRKRMLLSEDDVRAYYSRMFPVLRKALRRKGKKTGISDELRRKLRLLFGDDANLDDILMKDGTKNKFLKRLLLGASEELWEQGGASETVTSKGGASEQAPRGRKFFFELWTELLVYGRTEPDAHVHHGDKHIPLRPDGTFSLRFSLPTDTMIPLDFTAHSNDRVEKRTINTSAQRLRTEYGS